MTHARTLTRYACLAGLIAGLLAPVSSLAQGFPSGHPYHSSNSRANIAAKYGIAMSQQSGTAMVEVGYRARHTGLPGGVTRYTNGRALIPAATIRTGALSALARGVMHPGFQAAILAAGFILSNSNEIMGPGFDNPENINISDYPTSTEICWSSLGSCFNNPVPACFHGVSQYPGSHVYQIVSSSSGSYRCRFEGNYNGSYVVSRGAGEGEGVESLYQPVSQEDLGSLDPHIPPELVDELWADSGSIPEWEEAITMLPFDNVFAEGNTTSEVYQSARQANENLYAQLSGEPEPNPDQDTVGGTAADEMVDMWNQPIPPFPEETPEWQVEEITTLPDFSFGLGAGSCPAPVTIPHPLGGSFTIEFQKLCDLASMIRGAVIAICMILALYIVLGTRATTS